MPQPQKNQKSQKKPQSKPPEDAENSWYSMQMKAGSNEASIYIYTEIGYWGVTAEDFLQDLAALGGVSELNLYINSPGGDVFDGMAIYSQLKRMQDSGCNITAYVDGVAASMASVIACAANRLIIPENAYLMIHNPSTGAWGDEHKHRRIAEMLNTITKGAISVYQKRSGKSEQDIIDIMDEETWYTGAMAVEEGFADEASEAMDIAACIDPQMHGGIAKYQHAPSNLKTLLARQSITKKVTDSQKSTTPDITEPAGSATLTNEEQTMAKATDPAAPVTETPEQITAKALKADRQRRDDIKAKFNGFSDHETLMRSCQDDHECTPAMAGERLLAKLAENATASQKGRLETGEHKGHAGRMADMQSALEMKTGIAEHKAGNVFMGYSLQEMAREILSHHNIKAGDRRDMVGQAFMHSSGDFPKILSNIANKSMLKGYNEAEENHRRFCDTGVLTDFKPIERSDLNAFSGLDEIVEDGEYRYGTMGERAEMAKLATFGKLFRIGRQAIINDDLDAFSRIPRKMGRAAKRKEADLAFSLLTGNPPMADGKALFHADHNNLITGAAFSSAAFEKMLIAMAKQSIAAGKDEEELLNISPQFVIGPVALKAAMLKLRMSETDTSSANSKNPNIYQNTFEVITDARLDRASATDWYSSANPSMYDAIQLLFLDGVEEPFMEQQDSWTNDGVEFKVRLDVAAKAWDYRPLAKMTA